MGDDVIFQPWHYRSRTDQAALVFPDGCRDVLIISGPGQPPRVHLSPLDMRPRQVGFAPGTSVQGFRLRPGTAVTPALLRAVAVDQAKAAQILGNGIAPPGDLDDAIRALTQPGATAAGVAAGLGVTLRSLQRRFAAAGLPHPDYWRLLARARRAAQMLSGPASLAQIACDCGFSDQAHMTRETLRWFGAAPGRLRDRRGVLTLLAQPALGNWTGEQISIR